MNVKLLLVILLIKVTLLPGQNILVLEKSGGKHSYMYSEGDKIELTIDNNIVVKGRISFLDDSLVRINKSEYFHINRIVSITRYRRGFSIMYQLFMYSGIPYLAIVSLNRSLNNEYPIVEESTMIISGSLITAGLISSLFIKRKYEIDNRKWRLKMLDFTD